MKLIKKIIILGTGGTSRDLLDVICDLHYECVGFLDDDKSKWGKSIQGIKILGALSEAGKYTDTYFVNGIGSPLTFLKKEKLIRSTGLDEKKFITLIHPSAVIAGSVVIGRGSVIFPNVVVCSNAVIGKHVVVLPNSIISHDNEIGDYTCITGGVCVSGDVKIGKLCYLGAGSTIKEMISVGDKSLIGMGSVVLENIKGDSIYVGNPAKYLRPNNGKI